MKTKIFHMYLVCSEVKTWILEDRNLGYNNVHLYRLVHMCLIHSNCPCSMLVVIVF